MTIRKAQVNDAMQIKSLVASLAHFYLENSKSELPNWFAITLQESEFKRRLSNDDFINYVYVHEDKIVGYISIKHTNHLYHLFVDETYQGRGISKQLWSYACEKSVDSINTVRSSIYAIPIYKRFGFKEVGSIQYKDGIGFQPMAIE